MTYLDTIVLGDCEQVLEKVHDDSIEPVPKVM